MTDFYDSANAAKIPAGKPACLYYDGLYKASAAEARRLGPVRWITIEGGAAAAADTGCIDWEKGNPCYTTSRLRDWAMARLKMDCRARVYCNRSDLPAAKEAVKGLPNVYWWIATLDGNKLNAHWTGNLWAVQYQGGMDAPYDVSHLYGTW